MCNKLKKRSLDLEEWWRRFDSNRLYFMVFSVFAITCEVVLVHYLIEVHTVCHEWTLMRRIQLSRHLAQT